MILYAIKIGNKYLKEYVYYEKKNHGRYAGHGELSIILKEGDIIDLITTKEIERTETKRSIGNTIRTIYSIDKMKNKQISIIPIEE